MTPAVHVVFDEVVTLGWPRRRADRFVAALHVALPVAIEADRAAAGGMAPADRTVDRLDVSLARRHCRNPERAAAVVAAAIATMAAGDASTRSSPDSRPGARSSAGRAPPVSP